MRCTKPAFARHRQGVAMYTGLFLWWNPVFHFPLSGAVTQEFEQKVRTLEHQTRLLKGATFEIARLLTESGQKPSLALTEHLFALGAPQDKLDAGDTIGQRIEQATTLLQMLHSLDPEEFARLVQRVKEGKGE